MTVAELLAVVEVDEADRVTCQAPGCGHSVYKRIHVIKVDGQVSVLGSDCFRRLHGHTSARSSEPRFGTAQGRRLTDEERALLLSNTAAFVARMEAEHAEALARQVAAEEARRSEQERIAQQQAEQLRQERAAQLQRAERERQWTHDERNGWAAPGVVPGGADPLSRFRAQQAALAAKAAIARVPALAQYSLAEVADAMMQAKANCLAWGVKLEADGSRQVIEREALAILTQGRG